MVLGRSEIVQKLEKMFPSQYSNFSELDVDNLHCFLEEAFRLKNHSHVFKMTNIEMKQVATLVKKIGEFRNFFEESWSQYLPNIKNDLEKINKISERIERQLKFSKKMIDADLYGKSKKRSSDGETILWLAIQKLIADTMNMGITDSAADVSEIVEMYYRFKEVPKGEKFKDKKTKTTMVSKSVQKRLSEFKKKSNLRLDKNGFVYDEVIDGFIYEIPTIDSGSTPIEIAANYLGIEILYDRYFNK